MATATAAAKTARKDRPAESPTAATNGEKVMTVEQLAQDLDARDELFTETFTNMSETMASMRRTMESMETKLQANVRDEVREGAKEAVREEAKGMKQRIRYMAEDTVDLMVPGRTGQWKKDAVHLTQGLVLGFIGGRRLGPLPGIGA